MLDFLTAAYFKRVGDSLHFFPFGKRGYRLDSKRATWISRFIKAWWLITFPLLFAAIFFLDDPAQTLAVVGGGAAALMVFYGAVFLVARRSPRSEVAYPRMEQKIALLRAVPVPVIVGVGVVGLAYIVVAFLMYRDLPILWPLSLLVAAIGLLFIGASVHRILKKRRLESGV